jgi:hypothetical protein
MEETMLQLESRGSWKDALRKCCRNNKLAIDLASVFTPLRFRGAYARFKAMLKFHNSAIKKGLRTRLKGGFKMS